MRRSAWPPWPTPSRARSPTARVFQEEFSDLLLPRAPYAYIDFLGFSFCDFPATAEYARYGDLLRFGVGDFSRIDGYLRFGGLLPPWQVSSTTVSRTSSANAVS